MDNYHKGGNEETPLVRENINIPNLPDEFLWMHVRGGSKMRNLLSHALKEFPQTKVIVWTGWGPSVGKTISCAEIMKKEYKDTLHQINIICNRIVKEFWDPIDDRLDQLVVTRKLPMIHIALSIEALDTKVLGYQAPGTSYPIQTPTTQNKSNRKPNRRKKTSK